MKENNCFNRIQIGSKARITKVIKEEDIRIFAGLTGDVNPIHLDEEYAKNTVFGKRIAHGMLLGGLISSIIGTKLPGEGAIYLSQTLKFIAPVYINDVITVEVEVIEKITENSRLRLRTVCCKDDGKVVLEGEALIKYIGHEVMVNG